jgi:hypothetical protein
MKKKCKYFILVLVIIVILLFIPISSSPYMEMICNNIYEYKGGDIDFVLEQERSDIDLFSKYYDELQIRINIYTNRKINNIIMQSYCLKFNEINIEFDDSNYNRKSSEPLYKSETHSISEQCLIGININELKQKISWDISNDELYKIMKKNKTAVCRCLIKYEIDNKQEEKILIFTYDVKTNKGKTYVWELIGFMILFMIFGGQC